jgi:hypothetical protein
MVRMNLRTSSRSILLASWLLAPAAPAAFAQWSSNPALNTPVSVLPGDHAVPKLAVTGDGRTWLGWFDNRSGSYGVYVQLFDASGTPQFAADGLLVSSNPQSTSLVDWDLECAANGDAVLVFTDTRAGSDLDVYAYRITQSGTFAWGANGVTLSQNAEFEASPNCAVLDNGSSVFTWGRTPSSGTGSIRVQVLDAAGTPQFPMDGFGISGLTNERPGFADVVAAPGGSYIVSFLRNIASFSSPRHIKAQKFDSSGTALWNSGTPVVVFDASAVPIAYWPVIEPDGTGGAAFAWHYAPGNVFQCFVQKLSASGAELFPHNGVAVSLEPNLMKLEPALTVLQPSGDLALCFHRRNTSQSQWGVGAQRIDGTTGLRLWTDNGVELEPVDSKNESFQRIVPYADGVICSWFDNPNTPLPDARVLAQRLDGAGNLVWPTGGVVVSSQAPALASKDDLEVGIDSSGVMRATWDDNRSDPSGDIYAQSLNSDGTLGLPPCGASAYCIGAPNSSGPGASIGFSGSVSVAQNALTLQVSGAIASTSGIFFYGPNATVALPFRNGFLCVGGGILRLPVVPTSPTGAASYLLDLSTPPVPQAQITAGSAWSFQFWYRDSVAAPGFSNTSDALRVTFCP